MNSRGKEREKKDHTQWDKRHFTLIMDRWEVNERKLNMQYADNMQVQAKNLKNAFIVESYNTAFSFLWSFYLYRRLRKK
jgi:hypothetical protein